MRRIVFPWILLALLGGLAVWWLQPAQVLKRRTRKVLQTLTLAGDETTTNRKMGIYALSGLLASQVQLEPPPAFNDTSGSFDRSEIESAYTWLCDQAKQTHFQLLNIHSVTIHGDQADVAFLIDALVELPNGRLADGPYECAFHWQLENETWHLTRAKWVEANTL